jgi:hypothetical protein
MKKNVLTFLLFVSIFNLQTPSAFADGSVAIEIQGNEPCSSGNPCGSWAVVDSNNNVINAIVCQASVCGQNGSFGGYIDGNRVIPQIAPDPDTYNAVGGFASHPLENISVTENNGSFIITKNSPEYKETVVIDGNSNTTISTSTSSQVYSFSYEDTIGKKNFIIDDQYQVASNENTSAEIIATKYIDNLLVVNENVFYLNRQTQSEIENDLTVKNLNLIKSQINTILSHLNKWIK